MSVSGGKILFHFFFTTNAHPITNTNIFRKLLYMYCLANSVTAMKLMSYLCFFKCKKEKMENFANFKLLVNNRIVYRTDHRAYSPITTTPFLLDFLNRLFIHSVWYEMNVLHVCMVFLHCSNFNEYITYIFFERLIFPCTTL